MKNFKHLLFVLPMALFILNSCGSDEPSSGNQAKEDSKEKKKMSCNLKTMGYELQGKNRVIKFEYQDGSLFRAETFEDGEDIYQTMAFNYNDHGGMQAFLSGYVIAAYVYDDDHKILKIDGEKGLNTRTFEYNDQGQIVKQITMIGENPDLIHEYEYDSDGQPTKVSIYDKEGDLIEENLITYDDKKNPFKNKGSMINSVERLFGVPVGNHDHNVVEINKTYKKQNLVNGRNREAGESEQNRIRYIYNESGYPVTITRMRNGRKAHMNLTYECR